MKRNPFKTPDQYFDKDSFLAKDIMSKSELNKKAFRTPKAYFEKYEDKVWDRLKPKAVKSNSRLIQLWTYRVAAVFVLGLFLYPLFTKGSTDQFSDDAYMDYFEDDGFIVFNDPEVLDEINQDERIDIMDFIDEIDPQSVITYMEDENIDYLAYTTYYEE